LLAGLLASGAVVTAIAIARHDNPFNGPEPPRGPYVALGDSYTAGPDIPDQTGTPAGCDRSDHNYPALVAQSLHITGADFQDMSCSGATIADLTIEQSTADGVNPPQLSPLSANTQLVTIGIGGNDIGFGTLVKQCVTSGALYLTAGNFLGDSAKYLPQDAPCRNQNVNHGTDEIQQKIRTTGERLSNTLNEIKRRAPHAHVYIIGYPAILPSTDTGCGRQMPITPGDMAYLNEKQQQLNASLRDRAQAAGAGYVDTYTPSAGHDACSDQNTRWIEPLIPDAPAASVHPNERGERGMAEAILHTLAAIQ
jgi:lysophospholipase L1-like esterase